MFNKIKMFFARFRKDRSGLAELHQQIAHAQRLRDMVGVARKLKLTVIMTVEVGNVRQGVLLAGDGPEAEWLYNFACGEVLSKQADLGTGGKFGRSQWGGVLVHPDGRVEISGSEGP